MSTHSNDQLDELPDELAQATDGFIMIPPLGSKATSARPSRHTVTADAILSAEEVVELLGGRSSATRRWLRQVAPLPHPSGRRVYLWGDVIATLKAVA